MSHIFISYSKKNRDYARPLADHLLSLGFDVWIDDEIQPSEDWWRNIRMAIKDCAAFILVMTPEAENSHWVGLELLHGLEYKKPLFPLLLAGSPNLLESDSWSRIANFQFTDVRNRGLPSERFYEGLTRRGVPRKSQIGDDVTPPADSKQSSVGIIGDLKAKLIPKADAIQSDPTENSLPDVAALTAATLSILPPPFDWCPISAGTVTIDYSQTNHKTFDIPVFLMAKYPITNAQYQAFIDAKDGYSNSLWWDYSKHATSWRKANSDPIATAYPGDDLPRTNVSWYGSIAFTRWLSSRVIASLSFALRRTRRGQGGEGIITLPTEQQWQRAAQGNDNRTYPWGSDFASTHCNTQESDIGQPTPITQYLLGTSPFGIYDLSGNVWEWCLTTWDGDSTELGGDSYRVVRGGSWFSNQVDARAAFRSDFHPDARGNFIGFRIVCRPPSP